MRFEYLEEVATSDIAFRAEGKNLNELFENAAFATTETIADTKTIKQNIVKKITFADDDLEQLLFSFLSEIIYLKDAESLLFSEFKVKISGKNLVAELHGETINKNMTLRNDVKAITMHMLKIENKNNKYYGTIVLDI